ncbi:MAG: two-component system sensor histidine kinase NtrB [bacterium]
MAKDEPVGLDFEIMRPFLEGLLRNMEGGVFTVDLNKCITSFNKAGEWITGYCLDEVLGKPCNEILRGSLCKEGCVFEKVIRTGLPVTKQDVAISGKEGQQIYVSYTAFRLDDVHKKTKGIGVIFRDLTELKNLREQLIHSEKLVVMGQLAAGVAHEINNPINGIINYIHLFIKRLEENRIDPGTWIKDLKMVERETMRIGRLVRNLLNFAKKSELELRQVQMVRLIDETLPLLEDQFLLKNITVIKNYGEKIPDILGDFNQLQQVVINLIINAIQAVDKNGEIEITLSAEGMKGSECFVIVSITDNGIGIPEEDLPKIFDPFYTTKTKDKGGIGLGLTIVQQIVNAHHGRISIKSRVGAGTTVSVRLPTI